MCGYDRKSAPQSHCSWIKLEQRAFISWPVPNYWKISNHWYAFADAFTPPSVLFLEKGILFKTTFHTIKPTLLCPKGELITIKWLPSFVLCRAHFLHGWVTGFIKHLLLPHLVEPAKIICFCIPRPYTMQSAVQTTASRHCRLQWRAVMSWGNQYLNICLEDHRIKWCLNTSW